MNEDIVKVVNKQTNKQKDILDTIASSVVCNMLVKLWFCLLVCYDYVISDFNKLNYLKRKKRKEFTLGSQHFGVSSVTFHQ